MTVAEFIERLSKQNKDYVIYRDYGNGLEEASWDDFMEYGNSLEEASWNDFMELFWIWDKSEVEEEDD